MLLCRGCMQVKPFEEDTAGKKRSAKSLHIEHCLTMQLRQLPRGYTSNSPRESAMLEYVDAWATVFRSLYPFRRYGPLQLPGPRLMPRAGLLCIRMHWYGQVGPSW